MTYPSEDDVSDKHVESAFIVVGCVLAAIFIIGAVVVMNWLHS